MISINALEAFYQTPTILDLNSINTPVSHDRVTSTRNIQNDNEWHNNMIRNVGSYVAKGLSDEEIQTIASSYTRPGYTAEETKREVQKAIDGARAKGFLKKSPAQELYRDTAAEPLLRPIFEGNMSRSSFLVDGLIEDETISLLFGAPASGKSFIAMNIACSVASGLPFFEQEVKRGSVIYVAGEGARGLRKRAYAWCQNTGFEWGELSVLLSERSVSILDTSELLKLKDDIDKNIPKHGKPALIIVDTLNRNFGGGDENSNADMGRFIKALEHFQKLYSCNILIVHHSGHSDAGRVRGASALTAAVDAEYCVRMKQGLIEMSCTKMKDDEAPHNAYYELQPLPINLSGMLLGESLAVLHPAAKDKAFNDVFPKKYALGIETLIEAESLFGEQINKYGPKSVSEQHWKEVYIRRSPADSYEAKRKAFSRQKNGLVNDGFVEVNDNYFTRKEK